MRESSLRRPFSRRHDSRTGQPPWLWLITGLLVGFLLGLLYSGQLALPSHNAAPLPAQAAAPAAVAPAPPLAPKPAPHFEFYEVLPSGEAPKPLAPAEAPPAPAAETIPPAGSTLLQVGAFQNLRDADSLKAQLALLGLAGLVQPGQVNGINWFRVRVGPFIDPTQLEQTRATLRQHGFEAMPVRY